jgi:hypothetical protein
MDKETLEEAADNHQKNVIGIALPKHTFIAGAKWQAERMYSEGDMKQFAWQCVANFLANRDNEVEQKLVDVIVDRNNLEFEKFKKK